jgi:2-hydroxy-3-keto-5-methylthiopentenyl-1-phosphate phosphatase
MDDLRMFSKYLEEINKKQIPFIVISSGSSGQDVIPICQQYPFVKEVIIFCGAYKYNKH